MAKWQMPGMTVPDAPPPMFLSWADYIKRTSYSQRMARCHAAAKKANRERLLSSAPETKLCGADIWSLFETARGRCAYCGSLAVETRPSNSQGAPVPWAQVGRRVGSVEHRRMRVTGGGNQVSNLTWACLWCNDHPGERRPNAADHGGYYPVEDLLEVSRISADLRRPMPRPRGDVDDDGEFEMYPDHECPWVVGKAG